MDISTVAHIAQIVTAAVVVTAPFVGALIWLLEKRRRNQRVQETYDQLREWEDILEAHEEELFKEIRGESMSQEKATVALLMQVEERLAEIHAILMTTFTYEHVREHEIPRWLKTLEIRLLKARREQG